MTGALGVLYRRRRLAGIAAALPILAALPPVTVQADNAAYDRYLAMELAIGGDYYQPVAGQSLNSATLAWQESYVLKSYYRMYELTSSTAWLDKIVTHFDSIMGNARTIDGSAYTGWDTSNYPMNQLLPHAAPSPNDGFETAAAGDSTLPSGWTRFQSTSSTAYRSSASGDYDVGSWGVVLKTNGTSWQKLYRPLLAYEPSKRHTLRFVAKTNGGPGGGQAYIWDATTSTVIAAKTFTDTGWTWNEVEFVTPVAGHTLQVWLTHDRYNVTGLTAYFDEVRVALRARYLVHEGRVLDSIARFVQRVRATPSLQAAYGAKATTYLNFIESNIIPYWDSQVSCWRTFTTSVGNSGTYVWPNNTASDSPTCVHPHNQYLAFGKMLIPLWQTTGNSAYSDKILRMARYFKSVLRANATVPTAYVWDYVNPVTGIGSNCGTPFIEDVGYASDDLGFVAALWKAQISLSPFDGSSIDKFVSTLRDVMWNRSLTNPLVNHKVDHSGDDDTYTPLNWAELPDSDSTIWTVIATLVNGKPDNASTLLEALTTVMWWDPERVPNWNFESPASTDVTLPSRWTRWQSTSATAYLDTAHTYTGRTGLTIKTNGSTWQRVMQTLSNWIPGRSYTLTFYADTNGSTAGGTAFVSNKTTGLILGIVSFAPPSTSGWLPYSVTFTAPTNGSNVLELWLGHQHYSPSGGEVYFDNVRLKHTGDPI